MKRLILTILLVVLGTSAFGQSRTIERFRQEYKPDQSLFFYKSTLRMFARLGNRLSESDRFRSDDVTDPDSEVVEVPDLATMIDGIEKVKFFSYRSGDEAIQHFKSLQKDVESEGFESVMTARAQGADINILMREKRGKPDGFVVLITSEDGMSLIDLDGMPDLSNLMKLSEFMNTNKDSFSLLESFR